MSTVAVVIAVRVDVPGVGTCLFVAVKTFLCKLQGLRLWGGCCWSWKSECYGRRCPTRLTWYDLLSTGAVTPKATLLGGSWVFEFVSQVRNEACTTPVVAKHKLVDF